MGRLRAMMGVAALCGLCLPASGQTTSWLDATDGDWLDPLRWDNGVPGTGFDVVIGAIGSGVSGTSYTSTITSTFDIRDLLLDSSRATLLLDRSELRLAGTATLSRGLMRVNMGRISGGTIVVGPEASLEITAPVSSFTPTSVLDGVLVRGSVNLARKASLLVGGGTEVTGTVTLESEARLAFEGTRTVNWTFLQRDVGPGGAELSVDRPGSELTLGTGNTINATRLAIGNAGRLVINNGSVTADVADFAGIRFESPAINNGILEAVNGGRLMAASGPQFTNNGRFTIGAGSFGEIATASWTNAGTIRVLGDGVLSLGGGFGTAGSGLNAGRITGDAAARLNIRGNLDNTGQTLRTDAFGGLMNFEGVTISGGTLVTTDSADYAFGPGTESVLDGVLVEGDLFVTGPTGGVVVRPGTDITGAIILGDGGRISFEGTRTINKVFREAFLEVDDQAARIGIVGTGSELTFGTRNSIVGRDIGIGGTSGQSIINKGAITANVADGLISIVGKSVINDGTLEAIGGGRMRIAPKSFANNNELTIGAGSRAEISTDGWVNNGIVTVMDDAVLVLGGVYATAASGLNRDRITGGAASRLILEGRLDNTGQTLRIDSFGGLVSFDRVTVSGGVLDTTGAADYVFGTSSSIWDANLLDGVVVRGDLDLVSDSAVLRLGNGTEVTGTVNLANGSVLAIEGTRTIDWTIRDTSSSDHSTITIEESGTVLTFGAANTISGRGLIIGRTRFLPQGSIINDGMVSAEGRISFPGLASLVNNGTLQAIGGGSLSLGTSRDFAVPMRFTNNGQIMIGAGSDGSIVVRNWLNNGTVAVRDDGTLSLSGDFTTAGVGLDAGRVTGDAGSRLLLRGRLENVGRTLRTDAFGGLMTFDGVTVSGGTLVTTDGADYAFSGSDQNILDGVLVVGDLRLSGNSPTVRIASGTDVTGTVLLGEDARILIDGGESLNWNFRQTGSDGEILVNRLISGIVTLGAANTITAQNLRIGKTFGIDGGFSSIVNDGTVSADGVTDVFGSIVRFINLNALTNRGTFEAIKGGRLRVETSVSNFSNLAGGVLTGGTYRVGAGSSMDFRAPITTNAATIELLGAGAELVGLGSMTRNAGELTLANDAALHLMGDLTFDTASVFTVMVGGAGDGAITPELVMAGHADLGGRLILDFTGCSMAGLTTPGTYRFLSAASFSGGFIGVELIGLDPAMVLTDGLPGTFTIIPSPAPVGLLAASGLAAWRRRR